MATPSFLQRQLLTLQQVPRLLTRIPSLKAVSKGDGPVMVMPGFGTNDQVLLPLRSFLATRGYDTRGWGLGLNRGDVLANLEATIDQVERFVEDSEGTPAQLVGFSLGGVFAREVARDRPDLVSRICTFGTPVFRAPAAVSTISADPHPREVLDRLRTPIVVPITAIYSKNDQVVHWRSTLDEVSPDVVTVEVQSTHAGMTIDPDVWAAIGTALSGEDRIPDA